VVAVFLPELGLHEFWQQRSVELRQRSPKFNKQAHNLGRVRGRGRGERVEGTNDGRHNVNEEGGRRKGRKGKEPKRYLEDVRRESVAVEVHQNLLKDGKQYGLQVVEVGLILAHHSDAGGQCLEQEMTKFGVHGSSVDASQFFGNALNGKHETLWRNIFSGNCEDTGDS
jgi:hypothetical protein